MRASIIQTTNKMTSGFVMSNTNRKSNLKVHRVPFLKIQINVATKEYNSMTTFIQHMVVLIWNSTEYTYLRKTKCYGLILVQTLI